MTKTGEELQQEAATLEARRDELEADHTRTLAKQQKARDAMIDGTGTKETLLKAQAECEALRGTIQEINRRIEAKARELSSAQAIAQRAAQLERLHEMGLDFDAARAELDAEAERLAAAFTIGVPRLLELMKQLGRRSMEFGNLATEISSVPAILERDGQQVDAMEIRNLNFTALRAVVLDKAAHDLTAQRSLYEALEARSFQQSIEQQAQYAEENATLGLNDRSHSAPRTNQLTKPTPTASYGFLMGKS
jgi:DNA repair exonuclease SbcCD ATPase subunit